MASEAKTTADTILIVDHDDEQRGLLVDGLGQDRLCAIGSPTGRAKGGDLSWKPE